MEKQKVYIETSVISYLAAKPSRDIIVAGQQLITEQWWENRRYKYQLYISDLVIKEASAGDKNASERRLQFLNDIMLLEVDERVIKLSKNLMETGIIPKKAIEDTIHISVATINEIDYLLTWNCKHIANAVIYKQLRKFIANYGYELPTLCTPNELLSE